MLLSDPSDTSRLSKTHRAVGVFFMQMFETHRITHLSNFDRDACVHCMPTSRGSVSKKPHTQHSRVPSQSLLAQRNFCVHVKLQRFSHAIHGTPHTATAWVCPRFSSSPPHPLLHGKTTMKRGGSFFPIWFCNKDCCFLVNIKRGALIVFNPMRTTDSSCVVHNEPCYNLKG